MSPQEARQPESSTVAQAASAAEEAGLRYVDVDHLAAGIRRVPSGDGFRFVTAAGDLVDDENTLDRIRRLVIPPAWTDVWISPSPKGHIQAVGRDARGRKQYRYHPQWREVRDQTKYEQLIPFAKALPRIRRRVQHDLARKGLRREKVLATVVALLERTMMRVGNEEYARANQSFGLTTLRDHHVRISGHTLCFQFRGKSGKEHSLQLTDRRLARIVRAIQDIPGYELFQYLDEEGNSKNVESADVNAYLREVSGMDLTAKVFRTWAGTVRTVAALRTIEPENAGKSALVAVIKGVARQLGNTPTVCRKCYIHPGLLESYDQGKFHAVIGKLAQRPRAPRGLSADERLTLAFLLQWRRRANRKPRRPRPKKGLGAELAKRLES